jgi:hypothetical protein
MTVAARAHALSGRGNQQAAVDLLWIPLGAGDSSGCDRPSHRAPLPGPFRVGTGWFQYEVRCWDRRHVRLELGGGLAWPGRGWTPRRCLRRPGARAGLAGWTDDGQRGSAMGGRSAVGRGPDAGRRARRHRRTGRITLPER